jgi:formylglycine-generating enzyme required for sulfatase activity
MWDAAVAAGFTPPKGAERPDDRRWGREQRPVIHVSWDDAQAYCAWLNRSLGLPEGTYRLPSEAEFEYACRAGTETPFSFGATISTEQANYNGNYVYGAGRKGQYRRRTVPVASLPANAWGLHEMHGNVYEWVMDGYGRYPAEATDVRSKEHSGGASCVLRGGSFNSSSRNLRSAYRTGRRAENRNGSIGFRLARTLGD